MKSRFTTLLLITCLFAGLRLQAQDIHFSQFYAMPLLQNPAFTGFFDGNYRVGGIVRSQWRSVTTPYSTLGASGDLNISTGSRGSKDMFGVGMNVTTDRAGDGMFTTNRFDATSAYTKALDRFNRNFLSTGIQLSYTSARIDVTRLTFDENFDDGQTTEDLSYNSSQYADASMGMQYTCLLDKQNNFSIGAAAFHLNEPQQSFFGDYNVRVYRKYVVNASASIATGSKLLWFPKVNYSKQGPNSELNFGAFARYAIPNVKNYGVYFGMLHRWNDAFILVSRFDLKNVAMTFSYDFNYSTLAKVSHGMGGPELSVQYIGSFKHKSNKKVFCPIF